MKIPDRRNERKDRVEDRVVCHSLLHRGKNAPENSKICYKML